MKCRVTWERIALFLSMMAIYILPIYQLELSRIPVDSILLGLFLVGSVCLLFIRGEKLSIFEWIYLVMVFVCGLVQKSINPVVLLTPIVAGRFITSNAERNISDYLLHSRTPYFALIFTVIYSILYHGVDSRYLHTGIVEVNSSGYAVLLLGLIFYKRKKWLGKIIIVIGAVSLSRSYFLAIIIMFIFSCKKLKGIVKKLVQNRILKFSLILIVCAVALYIIGKISMEKYVQKEIVYETNFFQRVTNFYDLSNYFRFSVNTMLIDLFNQRPYYWLFGCKVDEFQTICREYAVSIGQWYKGNNPHNFLFSYVKLYGIAGVLDIVLAGKIIDKQKSTSNYWLFIIIILYSIFLSIGANGFWLFMSLSVLMLYKNKSKQNHKEEGV